ncbi:MAG: EamA family transporter [bacterium]|nr:EamA family transporter [bacterium]
MPGTRELIVLFVSISMGAIGQLFMKAGMNTVKKKSGGDLGPIVKALPRIFTNLSVLGGIALYLISTVFWLWILSRVPLSFAYPCISFSYVIIIIAGKYIFKERIDIWKLIAIILILLGVAALGFSETGSATQTISGFITGGSA